MEIFVKASKNFKQPIKELDEEDLSLSAELPSGLKETYGFIN